MIKESSEQKYRFVLGVQKFKDKQKDIRVKSLIDQYCMFHLRLTSVVDTDLPDKVMDDVRTRVQGLWKLSFLSQPIPAGNGRMSRKGEKPAPVVTHVIKPGRTLTAKIERTLNRKKEILEELIRTTPRFQRTKKRNQFTRTKRRK